MDQDLIEKIAEHEEFISQLYNRYAQRFPQFQEFWGTLAWEELDHAKRIRQLGEEISKNRCALDPESFNQKALDVSITYLKQQIEIAKTSSELLNINALSVALSVEKSIIDGKIFESFKGFYEETRIQIRELRTGVNDHYKTIEEAWLEQRRFS